MLSCVFQRDPSPAASGSAGRVMVTVIVTRIIFHVTRYVNRFLMIFFKILFRTAQMASKSSIRQPVTYFHHLHVLCNRPAFSRPCIYDYSTMIFQNNPGIYAKNGKIYASGGFLGFPQPGTLIRNRLPRPEKFPIFPDRETDKPAFRLFRIRGKKPDEPFPY